MIKIDREQPDELLSTEWLLTNSAGGFAMGTVAGINTRRYHGLLVAALNPPVRRYLALHSLMEEVTFRRLDGTETTTPLSTQQFCSPGEKAILHPNGFQNLAWFQVIPPYHVEWRWQVEHLEIVRRIRFAFAEGNKCRIQYEVTTANTEAGVDGEIRIRPLLASRSHHSIHAETPSPPAVERYADRIVMRADDATIELADRSINSHFHHDEQVWNDLSYKLDADRGQPSSEQVWSPGELSACFDRTSGDFSFWVHVSDPAVELKNDDVFEPGEQADFETCRLQCAARQFVAHRSQNGSDGPPTIIAGYPWFTDWGRDAMISMPGIMLCNKRYEEAESMLLSFARHMRNGLIPNHFDDHTGEALYNTVDASLWFVYAVYQLWRDARYELERAQELLGACRAIVRAYREGTDFYIFMDNDGLIAAGDETTQLTWMDAKRDGVVFTPRHGKAVEINALWFNALHCLAAMTGDDDERDELHELAERAGESFQEQFWWSEQNCLHDVLTPADAGAYGPDGKQRPNQIFAVSLPHSPLSRHQQQAVVDVVRDRFLTPYGLRTLDRDDPDYRGRYEGDMMQRDAAYHNGTVWPWLIGPYCESLLRINDFDDESKRACRAAIQPLIDSMQTGCLGQIAEIYDGDPPHRPDGCPAQAWSVAEVLRIRNLVESVRTG